MLPMTAPIKASGAAPVAAVETAPRSRGRPKQHDDAALKITLMQRTREIFLTEGYRGTTIDKVAAAAGISKKTFYRIFPSKELLFGEMVENNRLRTIEPYGGRDDLPIEEAMIALFQNSLSDEAEQARHVFMQLIVDEARSHPDLAAIFIKNGPERSRRQLREWLEAQQARGRIFLEDIPKAAEILLDMVFGGRRRRVGQLLSRAQREEHTKAAIRLFLRGALPRQAALK
jgi:AcrR family transcriptional regulator